MGSSQKRGGSITPKYRRRRLHGAASGTTGLSVLARPLTWLRFTVKVISMENWETIINDMVSKMGFRDYRLEVAPDGARNALFIYENEALIKEKLPVIVESLNHILQMIAKKTGGKPIVLDVNNYRHEREGLITELARAAAKKAANTKQDVSLPAMNSYERRLVHVELAIHPDVTTESVGEGKERYIVIKPLSK